ncbi:MAG: FAD-dependent oxidoreductase [bacterium]|nr:FAD-dependent oxidoreductase [bacterium]
MESRYDLIVVGGGIYGAALLWAATLRGLSAILVEKGDFSGATSANSLKTIHGGIRYLQNLDLPRIRESVVERRTLMQIAPHLIHPMPCLTPTYGRLRESRLLYGIAFGLYDMLSADRNRGAAPDKKIPSGRLLSLSQCREKIPGLDSNHATGGAVWHDAQAYDSERLVLSFLLSARERGAKALNYVEMTESIVRSDRIIGIKGHDLVTGETLEIMGAVVVNTTGPWINEVDKKLHLGVPDEPIAFARAVNLVIPRTISDHAFALRGDTEVRGRVNQSRLFFFAPWRDTTMIGTWYFPERQASDHGTLSEAELQSCVQDIQSVYQTAGISGEDVSFIHLGRVPLNGRKASDEKLNLMRHYRLVDHGRRGGPAGAYSVMGVKYTTARDVAEKTLDLISRRSGIKLGPPLSRSTPLMGGEITHFQSYLEERLRHNRLDLPPKAVTHLVKSYGTRFETIETLSLADKELQAFVPGSDDTIKGAVTYSLRNEFTQSLSDLVLRRTGLGSRRKPKQETLDYCTGTMAEALGWGQAQMEAEQAALLQSYESVR